MALGATVWGKVSDRYGRRIGFFATSLFTLTAGLGSAASPSYGVLLVFRFFVGFGVSGGHIAYTLFSEFVPRHSRANSLLMMGAFWTAGCVLEAGLAWAILPGEFVLFVALVQPCDDGWNAARVS